MQLKAKTPKITTDVKSRTIVLARTRKYWTKKRIKPYDWSIKKSNDQTEMSLSISFDNKMYDMYFFNVF